MKKTIQKGKEICIGCDLLHNNLYMLDCPIHGHKYSDDILNLEPTTDIYVEERDGVLLITLTKDLKKGDCIKVDLDTLEETVREETLEEVKRWLILGDDTTPIPVYEIKTMLKKLKAGGTDD